MFKDIECPILSIAESEETFTLNISVHKENRAEKENEMISEAISKLIDLLLDVEEESHTFGDLMEPLSFSVVVNPEIVKELQKHEDEAHKQHQFKIGDRVRFKTWKQMEEEYGLAFDGVIGVRGKFAKPMDHLCGTFATIKKIQDHVVILSDFSAQGRTDFVFTIDMIEPSPYYCGKVVCTKSNENELTVGKIYEVNDGRIKVGEDCYYPSIISLSFKSVEELNSRISIQFVEIKDE